MPRLTPNAPRKRLEWVLKTYWPKYTVPVADTFTITLYLLGQEDVRLLDLSNEASNWALGAILQRKERAEKILAEDLTPLLEALSDVRNDNDSLIPWVAKQLIDLWKAAGGDDSFRRRGDPDDIAGELMRQDEETEEDDYEDAVYPRDYDQAVTTLKEKAPAIAMWARETRQNMGQVTLAQALTAVADHVGTQTKVPPGPIVYEFPDGFTVQQLAHTDAAFKAEGNAMQNCIGGYKAKVNSGQAKIYSLRDPAGHPHVSMEWELDYERAAESPGGTVNAIGEIAELYGNEFMQSPWRLRGSFVQILGKQNAPMVDRYKPYVQKFIRERFDADPVSMLRAGASARGLKLRGANLAEQDLTGFDLRGAKLNGANMKGADLSGVNLTEASLTGTDLEDADLRGADLSTANLSGANLTNANLGNATLTDADLSDAVLFGANLSRANLRGADLTDADLTEATARNARFREAELDSVIWNGTKLQGADFTDAKNPPSKARREG